MQQGQPSPQDLQAEQAQQGVPGNVNLWAGVPDSTQVDPTGAPSIRGKTRKVEGHWEKVPGGIRYTQDHISYEENKNG